MWIVDDDFSAVVDCARQCALLADAPTGTLTVGFHHSVILGAAGAIVEGVKAGKIGHFFLIGGCYGAEPGRNYFSDYAEAVPENAFILTLGCGKYRIRKRDYGTLLGLPRLLDMGQCNDAYGAIQVAVGLAKAFGRSANDLPLTPVVSWFEQKAVAVLLTLLVLGVKGIVLGPNPPAFVSPKVFQISLQQQYYRRLTGKDAKADLKGAAG